jgi:hypothetical protein
MVVVVNHNVVLIVVDESILNVGLKILKIIAAYNGINKKAVPIYRDGKGKVEIILSTKQ